MRFCHLKVLHEDEQTQQIVPPDFVRNMWQVHRADFVRYEMDMWTCFGLGTFLWFDVPMLAEHSTVAERIEQTNAAVLAVYGPGGYDDDIWSDHSQLLRSIDESRAALRNVVNTNADPLLCAICSGPLANNNDDTLYLCCSKEICKSCDDADTIYKRDIDKCLLCGILDVLPLVSSRRMRKRVCPGLNFSSQRRKNMVSK